MNVKGVNLFEVRYISAVWVFNEVFREVLLKKGITFVELLALSHEPSGILIDIKREDNYETLCADSIMEETVLVHTMSNHSGVDVTT